MELPACDTFVEQADPPHSECGGSPAIITGVNLNLSDAAVPDSATSNFDPAIMDTDIPESFPAALDAPGELPREVRCVDVDHQYAVDEVKLVCKRGRLPYLLLLFITLCHFDRHMFCSARPFGLRLPQHSLW